MFQAI